MILGDRTRTCRMSRRENHRGKRFATNTVMHDDVMELEAPCDPHHHCLFTVAPSRHGPPRCTPVGYMRLSGKHGRTMEWVCRRFRLHRVPKPPPECTGLMM